MTRSLYGPKSFKTQSFFSSSVRVKLIRTAHQLCLCMWVSRTPRNSLLLGMASGNYKNPQPEKSNNTCDFEMFFPFWIPKASFSLIWVLTRDIQTKSFRLEVSASSLYCRAGAKWINLWHLKFSPLPATDKGKCYNLNCTVSFLLEFSWPVLFLFVFGWTVWYAGS